MEFRRVLFRSLQAHHRSRACGEQESGEARMTPLKVVGGSPSRIDGLDKVTGAATYVDDIAFGPDLLHAEVVESPHAHALIKSIDTSAAEKVPGVVRVVTGKDFPYRFGLYMQDRFSFPTDRVRF